jgi:ribosomal protein S18 acetylase RimI-like enzyme
VTDRISPLQPADLGAVAQVHRAAFPDAALTRLGDEAVRRYYEWQLTGPHDSVAVGATNQAGQLVGFCFAGQFRGAFAGFVRNNRRFLAGQVARRPWILLNRNVRARALQSGRTASGPVTEGELSNEQGSFGVLAIAVSPAAQGSGAGSLLMRHIERAASEQGFSQLHLTVDPENAGAVKFYESLGWRSQPSPNGVRMVKQCST